MVIFCPHPLKKKKIKKQKCGFYLSQSQHNPPAYIWGHSYIHPYSRDYSIQLSNRKASNPSFFHFSSKKKA